MTFDTSEVPRLTPNNISDSGLRDEDSGLRLFRGMISPWDRISSFRETYNFAMRFSAGIATGYMHALRILEPDYEKAQTMISDSWASMMDMAWQGTSKDNPQLQQFEDRFDVPPFWKKGVTRAALYADKGDQQTLIPGHIWYTANDRFEKEIHDCQFAVAGPEACDISLGGGSHFCYGLAGGRLNGYDSERIGNGDDYCLAVQEDRTRYGRSPNSNPDDEFGPGYREWEGWGPTGGGEREEGMPRKEECEFLSTGYFESPTGARWTAGEMYKDFNMWPFAYSYCVIDAFRNAYDDDQMEFATHVIRTVFEAGGKFEFLSHQTRKAYREWMGVPEDIDDATVMGGYISLVMQSLSIPWHFVKFDGKETIVECDQNKLYLLGMYPEYLTAFEALFNGNVKSLVRANYSVDAESDLEDKDGNDVVRFTIHKRPEGFRRKKPHLHDYATDDSPAHE